MSYVEIVRESGEVKQNLPSTVPANFHLNYFFIHHIILLEKFIPAKNTLYRVPRKVTAVKLTANKRVK